jgi:antitoxin component of MazEF toxin-antitoxin module
MPIEREVKKVGGSLGVLIPRDIAEMMRVSEGSRVLMTLVGSQLVIEPTVDSVDDATFQRAFSAVLRRDGDAFAWLADFDRGLEPRPVRKTRARPAAKRHAKR